MEKRNYNSMYKSKTLKEINEEVATTPVEESTVVVDEAPIIEEPKEKVVIEETKVEKKRPEVAKAAYGGTVTGGLNLNVRKTPNGEIIKIIPNNSRVVIVDKDSNAEWYEISEPVKGFVMKKFISL